MRSWTPTAQAQHGFLVTHNESISIADYFTRARGRQGGLPADLPLRLPPVRRRGAVAARDGGRGLEARSRTWHILDENEIVDGIDELGVLLYGHAKNAYWYGSQLSIEETRKLAPYQNATGLQVTSAVLAGIVWMLENPDRGIVEADEMDFRRCLEIQRPYLGPVIGHYTDWTPLAGRRGLFPEDIDTSDPVAVQERARRLRSRRVDRDTGVQRPPCVWRRAAIVANVNAARDSRLVHGVSQIRCTCTAEFALFVACPISHVPVAACRSVGSGQEAGQPPTEERSSLLGVLADQRSQRTPM